MNPNSASSQDAQRERMLRVLSLATLVIFFQAFMVAPIIPRLSEVFGVSPQEVGLIVPAYLIPYGIATLVYGLLADKLGLWRNMAASLLAFAALTALTATARSVPARQTGPPPDSLQLVKSARLLEWQPRLSSQPAARSRVRQEPAKAPSSSSLRQQEQPVWR